MIPTFRVLMHMGALQRLFPLWLIGIAVLAMQFTPWFLLALVYGAILQFFVEYLMHRFLLHKEPPASQPEFNDLYRSHIGHHEFPDNPEFFTGGRHWYAFKFALKSFIAHVVVLLPFVGLAPAASWSAVALFVGSVSAFTFYEYCHTLAHLRIKKGWFGRYVTREHLAHHYQDHHATFHVSAGMGWIDRLMGTPHDAARAKERFDRRTLLSIGMDPDDLRLVTARKAYGLPTRPGQKTAT